MDSLFDDIPDKPKSASRNVFSTLGASNHANVVRAEADLYCTHPEAVEKLLEIESFNKDVWEPCCGLGHISGVLERHGHKVRKSDIISRREDIEVFDFLSIGNTEKWAGDIITNPPYNRATEAIYKALSVVKTGCKVAMWLRILFLESLERKKLFTNYPPSWCIFHLNVFHVRDMATSIVNLQVHKVMPGLYGKRIILAPPY